MSEHENDERRAVGGSTVEGTASEAHVSDEGGHPGGDSPSALDSQAVGNDGGDDRNVGSEATDAAADEAADATADEMAADADDEWDEHVETVYEQTPRGHRVTRRVTRRRTTKETVREHEEFEEQQTEVTRSSGTEALAAGASSAGSGVGLPPAYQAPSSDQHPAPVG